jgi:hypothetical protein
MGSRLVLEDRRSLDGLTQVVDDALTLADDCGWSYALAYLISERVPSQVIQRLLSGNARARKTVINTDVAFPDHCDGRKSSDTDEMKRLFTALRVRRTRRKPGTSGRPPVASRGSGPFADEE